MPEGGSAQQVPQQAQADLPAGALGDQVEVQRVPAAQPAMPQHGAQRRLRLAAQRRAPLRLGEHQQEVQVAAPRHRRRHLPAAALVVTVGRSGRRGAEAAGGAREGLSAAAQVVEGADGQGGGQRQGAGLGASPAPARAAQRRHAGGGGSRLNAAIFGAGRPPSAHPAPAPQTEAVESIQRFNQVQYLQSLQHVQSVNYKGNNAFLSFTMTDYRKLQSSFRYKVYRLIKCKLGQVIHSL